ncbi:MAG TPA: hypothetical protein VGO62_16695, partial [Myxococcota bacterium]
LASFLLTPLKTARSTTLDNAAAALADENISPHVAVLRHTHEHLDEITSRLTGNTLTKAAENLTSVNDDIIRAHQRQATLLRGSILTGAALLALLGLWLPRRFTA